MDLPSPVYTLNIRQLKDGSWHISAFSHGPTKYYEGPSLSAVVQQFLARAEKPNEDHP